MKPNDLALEIDIEFEAIQATIDQLASLQRDVGQREPTVRELAAAVRPASAKTIMDEAHAEM